jgi:O-acetyl-ADP-ribose deacetylase (regulator of RNase III)
MITYLKGDATEPVTRPAIIAHICNDIGLFGAGFAKALAIKYPKVKQTYLDYYYKDELRHGKVIYAIPNINDTSLIVAHMVAQRGVISKDNPKPLMLDALKAALTALAYHSEVLPHSIHMPRIGCGLAG